MNETEKGRVPGVTWRAILIGLILIPPNVFWVVEVECIWHSGHPTTISLFWNVVLNLFFLILINLIIKQFWPKAALSQGEMITIYVILSIASGLAGHDFLQLTAPTLPHAYWFATPENEWQELFHPYIPKHLVVKNKELLLGYYEGKADFYQKEIIMAWLGPTLWWTSLFFALGLMMICINVLIRRQWTEHEKLAYPIIQLPMAITDQGGTSSFFKNRLLWIGFIIAGLLDVWHGLVHFFPVLPDFSVRHEARNLGQYFTEKPWNAIGWVPVPLYPFVIGLGFLLPLDLSFSIWFFYIFRKLQFVFGSAVGMRSLPGFPYQFDQAIGAWIALFLSAIWVTRRHLMDVFKSLGAVLKTATPGLIDDTDEPIRYRTAVIIIALAGTYVVFWGIKAGMTIGIIAFYFGFYFAISFAITRVRTELGPPAHEMAFATNAPSLMVNVLGTRKIGARNLTLFPYMWGISGRGYRENIMPHQLEGFKMAEQAKMNRKRLVQVMALAVLVGTLASFWAMVSEFYRVEYGLGIDFIKGQFTWCANQIAYPKDADITAIGFTIGGALFTFFLMLMRVRFIWWPFHPAGYALSMPFGVEYFWTCLIISSIVKWVVLKYGGISMHHKARFFFFGVILGEYCVGAFWSAMSVIIGAPIYDFAPG